MLRAGSSPDTGQPYTEEEWQLRERLRLEALERRSRSLRSSPVAQTYRQAGGAAGIAVAQGNETDSSIDAMRAEGAAALQQALDTMGTVTTGLEDEVAAEAEADRAFIEALGGTPSATATPAVPTASAGPATARDYSSPPRVRAPEDPPGWERIHEGSFLEAALVTQLSGDFPGPVLAVVSVPFYSADRQRILSAARGAGHRHGPSRGEPGPIAPCRQFPPLDPARTGAGFHWSFMVSINSAREP